MGELARADAGIAHGLSQALLEVAGAQHSGERAEDLSKSLPRNLTCSREEPTGKLVVRERSWWRPEDSRHGRLDWVFFPQGQARSKRDFQLAVEVKIGAGLAKDQLAHYHLHLSRKRGGQRGLLVLSRTMPQDGLLDDAFRFWLGVVLWEHLLPRLREVRPDDDELAVQWPLLLDVLETRDDLGTSPVTWAAVSRANSRDAMRRLVEGVRPHARVAFQQTLKKRPTASGLAADLIADLRVKSTRAGVIVDLRVPSGETRAVGQLKLRGTDAGIDLVSSVYLRPKLGRQAKRRHDEAVRRLMTDGLDPRYTRVGASDVYERTFRLPVSQTDVQLVVSDTLEHELSHIASSGVLDEDLRDVV